jgi:hypothetical protein
MRGSLRPSDARLTFENHDIVWHPYVSKYAFPLFGVQVNTAQIWLVNKNVDSIVAFELEILRGFHEEIGSIGIPGGRKFEIEVRILPQRNLPFVFITRKIPENFLSR